MYQTPHHELELHHFAHIDKNLSALLITEMTLSVPIHDDAVLINTPDIIDQGKLTIKRTEVANGFEIYRSDVSPDVYMPRRLLQVREADERQVNYGVQAFYEPIDSLQLSQRERFLWDTNVANENIRDRHILRDFVGILSVFALARHIKLKKLH